jgi:glycosyltransferase involved in cell wall biosynthesis
MNQDEVKGLMQDAAVFCLPCIRDIDGNQDALPTVLLESLARGLPIVSTRLSGIPEIIDDGACGTLVEPGDPKALSAALEQLLASPDLRRRYAEAGRRKAAEHFSLKQNAATLRRWFEETHDDRLDETHAPTEAAIPADVRELSRK